MTNTRTDASVSVTTPPDPIAEARTGFEKALAAAKKEAARLTEELADTEKQQDERRAKLADLERAIGDYNQALGKRRDGGEKAKPERKAPSARPGAGKAAPEAPVAKGEPTEEGSEK